MEKPDLTSLMDIALQDTKGRVLHTMKKVHARNMERVQLLDHVVREVYSIRAGLVNDGMEVIRRYGKLATALNVWQQQLLRCLGLFSNQPLPKKAAPRLASLWEERILLVQYLQQLVHLRRRGVKALV